MLNKQTIAHNLRHRDVHVHVTLLWQFLDYTVGTPTGPNTIVDISHEGPVTRKLWCFPFCYTEYTIEQTIVLPVISDVMMLIWRHGNVVFISMA